MASLYEINQEIMECIDLETGEILDLEKLESLQLERDIKLENIALWYKNLLSDADQYKQEKDKFAEREKAAKNKAESLKRYLDASLGGQKFNTTRVAVSYRKSTTLEYDGLADVPEEYLKYADPTIDKTTITKELKDGKEIAGFELKEHQNIQIK